MKAKASIIFLTKNGGSLFIDSLNSVLSQIVNFVYEVIVVDSGSTDETMDLVKCKPVKYYTIRPEDFNFGATRDYGFSLAEGEIVIAISQDAVPADNGWLQNLIDRFVDESVSVVQGADVLPYDRQLFFWDKAGLFYFTRECQRWSKQYNGIGISFTCCAIRRSVWEKNRLGRVPMSEDKIFQRNIVTKGHKIVFAENARCYHSHMYSLSSLRKRCENEGLGWRIAGNYYSFVDMVRDLCNLRVLTSWLYGLKSGQIRSVAELLFPLVRPVCVFKGNKLTKNFVR